ncbi:hypothetical protein PG999_005415 [Apiospora kogelbergensis]|uniref:J domain-containing protein n=1 Tax=Apiospora kogelbergensis TaxID=1337665 RepID=A0AAW0R268_9PEZI
MKKEPGLLRLGATGGTTRRRMHGRWQHEHQVLTRWPSAADCNPYTILEQARGGPYNKRRFYELVMVYHPDRWVHGGEYHGVPKATRVERYRQILAANAILSDPARRRVYDEHGVGWAPGEGGGPAGAAHTHQRAQTARRRGGGGMNAVWEDWEEWRDEGERAAHGHGDGRGARGCRQQAVFMRNRRFVLTLLLLASTGSCLMLLAVGTRAKRMAARRLKTHEALLEELPVMGTSAARLGRQERIDLFLARRLAGVARQT